MSESPPRVQLELPTDVLCRLLRERSLVASEFRSLNQASSRETHTALKRSLTPRARTPCPR